MLNAFQTVYYEHTREDTYDIRSTENTSVRGRVGPSFLLGQLVLNQNQQNVENKAVDNNDIWELSQMKHLLNVRIPHQVLYLDCSM